MPEDQAETPKATLASLLKLAWPILVSRSTQVIVGLSDALLVAHLGEASLAAVTAGALNSVAAFIFPMGITFILASFSSQLAGKGRAVEARRFGWYGLILALLAQVVMLLLLPGLPWGLRQLHYAPDVEAAMVAFLSIRLLSTGVVVGMEALGNYYSGLGNTSILMRASVAAMVMNVGLNWLLIDGHWGFPALGVRGSAWASVIATSLAFAGFFGAFLWHGRAIPKLRLRLPEFVRMLRFGLPAGLNWSFEFFAFIAFVNLVVASLGTSSLAAMMAVMQVNSLAFMPAFGLSCAGAILVGQAIGAGRKDDVGGIVRLVFYTNFVWVGLLGTAYLAIPATLLAAFVPAGTNGAFLAVGVPMLMMSALWQFFDAAGITLTEALRAAGDTAYIMWTRGILAWGVFLPGAWVCVRWYGGGEKTALAWLMVYLGLLALVLFFRFRGGAWRQLELVEPDLTAAVEL